MSILRSCIAAAAQRARTGMRLGAALSCLGRFRADRRGNVAMIFAMSLVPIMALIGAAVDYSRAAAARAKLQAAVDAATLSAARNAGRMTDAQIADAVARAIRANMEGESGISIGAIRVSKVGNSLKVDVDSNMETALWNVIGIKQMDVDVTSQARWNTPNIEVALVLDNTGSMASSGKMTELKKAVRQFLTDMEAIRLTPNQVRISVVPFDTMVNIGTGTVGRTFRNSNWIRFDTSDLPNKMSTDSYYWTGCLTDRDQPNDTNDAAPTNDATRYRAARCSNSALAQMTPLTADFDAVRQVITLMQPSGNTNITIGTQLGLATLTSRNPFTETNVDPNEETQRFMVLLTDGENTENRFGQSSYSIDARTRLACTAVKNEGITLFTVRVIDGNETLLKACATQPPAGSPLQYYFSVRDAAGIGGAFRGIADMITRMRLSI